MLSEPPTTEPHSELGFLNNQEFQWDVLWKTILQEALEHLEFIWLFCWVFKQNEQVDALFSLFTKHQISQQISNQF